MVLYLGFSDGFAKDLGEQARRKSRKEIKQNVAAMDVVLRRQAFGRPWEIITGNSKYKETKMPHSTAEDEVKEIRAGSESHGTKYQNWDLSLELLQTKYYISSV